MILISSLSEPKSVQRNEKNIQKSYYLLRTKPFVIRSIYFLFCSFMLNSLFMHNLQADQITIAQIHSFIHSNMQFRFHLSSLIIIKL